MDARTESLHARIEAFEPTLAPPAGEVERLLTCPPGAIGRTLLRPGNEKLSTRILTFGLPAVLSCPGRTELCGGAKALCYATQHNYRWSNVVIPRLQNFVLAHRTDFAYLVLNELAALPQRVVRPHDSGDLFGVPYALAWLDVFRRSPGWRHFLFSRSWRVEGVDEVLEAMCRTRNVRVWYSVDRETGWPEKIPARARLAYMQVAEDDLPERPVDLVFRDHAIRHGARKRVAGSLVCPYENGITRDPRDREDGFSCHSCGLCWGEPGSARDPRSHHDHKVVGTRRRSLKLLAS